MVYAVTGGNWRPNVSSTFYNWAGTATTYYYTDNKFEIDENNTFIMIKVKWFKKMDKDAKSQVFC